MNSVELKEFNTQLHMKEMMFPRSYNTLWEQGETLLDKVSGMLKDYMKTSLIWHPFRNFRKDEDLASIVDNAEGKRASLKNVLRILNSIRTKVLVKEYPFGVYGIKRTQDVWFFHRRSTIEYEGEMYSRDREAAGSLFSRCRYILLRISEALNEKYERTSPSEKELEMLRACYQYFVFNSGISRDKPSTSLWRATCKISLSVIGIVLLMKLGGVAAVLIENVTNCTFLIDGLPHHAIHNGVHSFLEKLEHRIT